MTNFEIAKNAGLICLASLAIFLCANWQSTRLPKDISDSRPYFEPPIQQSLAERDLKTFTKSINGHTYSVSPKFRYRLRGLVVSLSETSSLTNITHAKAGDYFNTNDLCVIWGSNAKSLNLRDFDFWNGDWTCYVQTDSSEAWSAFDQDGLSNTHVLPSTPEIRRALARVRIGDQIEATGQLVDYSTDSGPLRTTSTVRTDRGNGACEVMYVEDFKILKRPNQKWFKTAQVSGALSLLSGLVALIAFFVLPFLRKNES